MAKLDAWARACVVVAICNCTPACDSNSTLHQESRNVNNGGAKRGETVIGLVLADFDFMFYQSKNRTEECPDGFVYRNQDNWEAQFPTKSARREHLSRCGDVRNRGPKCENVWTNPTVLRDPLPFRAAKGKLSYGANLDGTTDGAETENTCAHEKFVSPEGKQGIDNQYYRFLACEKAVDPGLFTDQVLRRFIKQWPVERLLLEIAGVDDERNDNHVEIAVFRGRDPLIVDAGGRAVPWQSQRTGEAPLYTLRGRIVDGVVITEPADVSWESFLGWERRLFIRGMTLRLTLTPTGASGVRAGYLDVEQLWQSYSIEGAIGGTTFGASAPSAYAALYRLADGYKEPQTGHCSALSSARGLEFVRAYLVHPSKPSNP